MRFKLFCGGVGCVLTLGVAAQSGHGARLGRRDARPFRDGTHWLQDHRRHDGAPVGAHPLPTFERTFEYDGLTYTDRLVGTDPSRGPRTTRIKTLIIPLRLDFGDGVVLDAANDLVEGRTPLDWALQSPVFAPTEFNAAGTRLGTTQWADAMIRANFWSEGGSQPGFHVLLDPSVLPSITISVPPDKGDVRSQFIDFAWLDEQVLGLLAQLDPDPASLPIVLAGHDLFLGGFADGYHSARLLSSRPNGPLQTYIVLGTFSGFHDAGVGATIGHEVAEWLNNPFISNSVPPWHLSDSYCLNYMEVSDYFDYIWPDGLFPITTTGGVDYIMEDMAFFDRFTRRPVSRSVNGWYSFHNTVSTPTDSCYDVDRFLIRAADVPGALSTYLGNINNFGDIVGGFTDASGVDHGVVFANGTMWTLDVPGALATYPGGINDDRRIVGAYITTDGASHGFTYRDGRFSTLDPVAGAQTSLNSISNHGGDIAGAYFPPSGSPAIGGLLIRGGVTHLVMPPFATDASVSAVSLSGRLTGVFGASGDGTLDTGFVGSLGHLTPVTYAGPNPPALVTYPTGIADPAVLCGFIDDADGIQSAFYLKNGHWSRIGYGPDTLILGMNDEGIAVGQFYDDAAERWRGMIVRERR